ncbi:hypothetical protein VPH35_043112 [Triticum aestivum]
MLLSLYIDEPLPRSDQTLRSRRFVPSLPSLFWFPSGSPPISPPNQPSRPSPLFSAKGQPYPPLDPLELATDPLLLDFSYQQTFAFFCLLSSQGRGHSLGARAPIPELQPPCSVQPCRPPGPLLLLCFLLPPLPISSSLTISLSLSVFS